MKIDTTKIMIYKVSLGLLATLGIWVLTMSASANICVKDDTLKDVCLKKPAQRIISLAPHTTEMLFSAGAGEKLVGAVDYSDYPEAALEVPRVGSHINFDLEKILALKPDLIVAWSSGNPTKQVELIQRLRIPIYFTQPQALSDIPDNINKLAKLANTKASAATQGFNQDFQQLKLRYAKKDRIRFFYQIWQAPLMTLNGDHIFEEVINICRGDNIFKDLPNLASTVSIENVLQANPNAIIASGMATEHPEWLEDWKKFPQIKAVKNHHLYFINPDTATRPTVRLLQGAQELCQKLDLAR